MNSRQKDAVPGIRSIQDGGSVGSCQPGTSSGSQAQYDMAGLGSPAGQVDAGGTGGAVPSVGSGSPTGYDQADGGISGAQAQGAAYLGPYGKIPSLLVVQKVEKEPAAANPRVELE